MAKSDEQIIEEIAVAICGSSLDFDPTDPECLAAFKASGVQRSWRRYARSAFVVAEKALQERHAEIANAERVEDTGEETDSAYNMAIDHVCEAILSKEPTK